MKAITLSINTIEEAITSSSPRARLWRTTVVTQVMVLGKGQREPSAILTTHPRTVALNSVLRTLSTITACKTSTTVWCLILMLLLMKKAASQRRPEVRTVMVKPCQGLSEERCSMIG